MLSHDQSIQHKAKALAKHSFSAAMSSPIIKIAFTDLCINGQLVACQETINTCHIFKKRELVSHNKLLKKLTRISFLRHYLTFTITPDISLELEFNNCLCNIL